MSFHRLSLIIRREYFSTVGKRSFILMTLLMPILIIVLCALPAFLAGIKSDEVKNIAVMDATGRYGALLKDTEEYHFYTLSDTGSHSPYECYEQESARDVYAIVAIPATVDSLFTLSIYSSKSVPNGLSRTLSDQLEPALRNARIEAYGIEELTEIIKACDVQLDVQSIKWDESGDERVSEAIVSQILGLVLALLTYMFVLSYGAMIMNGVIEEKTNRIVEVIVSSCRPMELMLGKIIGVAMVGLTQIAIWGVLVIAGLSLFGLNSLQTASPEAALVQQMTDGAATADAAAQIATEDIVPQVIEMIVNINWGQMLGCFLLYFIGGYLLYAALFAAFGSAVDQPSDASQFTLPVMMILIFALYAGMYSIDNPDGPLAWWCSIIPFTSPIVMMVRLPYDVPAWEVALSLALLFFTALGTVYLAGRIYRTGILMYGKKISFREILKWVK
jgi:ABC-2 type transport system permease protein